MSIQEFLEYLRQGGCVVDGSELHRLMCLLAQEVLQITTELNHCDYRPEEIHHSFSKLTGKSVPDTFSLFPPFYSECGKNTFDGENVFINCGCNFQDHVGIYIGDGTLIGSYVVMATINYGRIPRIPPIIFRHRYRLGKMNRQALTQPYCPTCPSEIMRLWLRGQSLQKISRRIQWRAACLPK